MWKHAVLRDSWNEIHILDFVYRLLCKVKNVPLSVKIVTGAYLHNLVFLIVFIVQIIVLQGLFVYTKFIAINEAYSCSGGEEL